MGVLLHVSRREPTGGHGKGREIDGKGDTSAFVIWQVFSTALGHCTVLGKLPYHSFIHENTETAIFTLPPLFPPFKRDISRVPIKVGNLDMNVELTRYLNFISCSNSGSDES
jgi:hypothetical protein